MDMVVKALSYVEKKVSFLSTRTRVQPTPSIFRLLKAILLCTTRDKLHAFQLEFLRNGCFLHHLHAVVQGSVKAVPNSMSASTTKMTTLKSDPLLMHKEMVMVTVLDSTEGFRVLGRVFPMPLVKKLDSAPHSTRLKEVSYDEPRPSENTGAEANDPDQMALCMVFKPDRTNWQAFWMALREEESGYNFIWNTEMLQQVQTSLQQELADLCLSGTAVPEWDYDGFRVPYPQLREYLCVDGYYLQLVLESYQSGRTVSILHPVEFVRHLMDLFIVTRSLGDRRALLQLVAYVVQQKEAAVKDFPSMTYLCFLLEEPVLDPVLENLILNILQPLCAHQRNTEQFQEHGGVESLTNLLARDVQLIMTGQNLSVEMATPEHFVSMEIPVARTVDRLTLVLRVLQSACHSMPRIRGDLLTSDVLSRLLRVPMLVVNEEMVQILLDIITLSLASCPRAQATIHRTGLFRVLLLCSCGSTGMHPAVAEILYRYHLLQDPTDLQAAFGESNEKIDMGSQMKVAEHDLDLEKQVALARKYSYLRFFLPQALIARLVRYGPARFVELFNAESIESSDVLWSSSLRALLDSELQQQIADYVQHIHTDRTYAWKYTVPSIVQYDAIDAKLCVHSVFLEAFLREDCAVPEFVKPYDFLDELIRELDLRLTAVHKMKTQPDELTYKDIDMILRSLLKLLRTKKEISHVEKRVFMVLSRCLTATLSVPSNLLMANNALEVILEALRPQSCNMPVSVNICECADANCIVSFDRVLQECIRDSLFDDLRDKETLCSKVLFKTMSIITLMASHKNQRVQESLAACPAFVHTMQLFIFIDNIEEVPAVGLEALRAFELFLQDEKLLEIAVNSGVLIYLTQIALCLELHTAQDQEIVKSAVTCLELLAGVGNEVEPPTLVRDAMTQLLTPGLMKALRDHTMLEKMRSQSIRQPLLIWNLEMATFLSNVLTQEDGAIGHNEEAGNAYWDIQAFCRTGGYLNLYQNLQKEDVVDEVFLGPFLEHPDAELTDPTPDHFMKELMENLVQLQNPQLLSRSTSGDRKPLLDHLLVSARSLQALLDHHTNLHQAFVNDANIHRLFDTLADTTIGWEIQKALLGLLQTAVRTQSGCTILVSVVPSLRTLLQSNCEKTYMPVLSILDQFVAVNDQVVQSILSSALILVLLDMILFFEKTYNGDVQDMAVILLGRLMSNFQYGQHVRTYVQALFNPLFRGEHEYSKDLLDCHTEPSKLLQTLNAEIYLPTVYWDAKVRDELKQFLRSEARMMRTSDQEYEYEAEQVSKRMKPARVTLNQQLVVADIFIRQYVQSPFCEMNAPAFLQGLMEKLEAHVPQLRSNEKRDDYSELMKALNLFLLDPPPMEDKGLYSVVVRFLVGVLRDNVSCAKTTALATLKHVVENDYGLEEFERNNACTEEASYLTHLLIAASLDASTAFDVLSILKTLISRSRNLCETVYHAGILFYALESVLSNNKDIDTPGCVARQYLDIIHQLVEHVPEAEADLLQFTTSRFAGQFKKAPSLVNLFLRQPHEGYGEDGSIRLWSVEVREALRGLTHATMMQLNAEVMTNGWDRKQNRFTLDDVNTLWKKYLKKEMKSTSHSLEEEPNALKRVTMFELPTATMNASPLPPARPRMNSQ